MSYRTAIVFLLLLTACKQHPSRSEALQAFRIAQPGIDSGLVHARVWSDGPPWFSCAEIMKKLDTPADSTFVRNQLTPWRSLVRERWVTLKDSTAGPVVDPGWCVATLVDAPKRLASGWRSVQGDSLPSGGLRRGWDVLVGRRRVTVPRRTAVVGPDSARATYVFTVDANENGVAAGSDRERSERSGLLRKVEGRWTLVRMDDAP